MKLILAITVALALAYLAKSHASPDARSFHVEQNQ